MSKPKRTKKRLQKEIIRRPVQPSKLAQSIVVKKSLQRSKPYLAYRDSFYGVAKGALERQSTQLGSKLLSPGIAKKGTRDLTLKRSRRRSLTFVGTNPATGEEELVSNVFTQSLDVHKKPTRSNQDEFLLHSFDFASLTKSNVTTPKARAIRDKWVTSTGRSFAKKYNIHLKDDTGYINDKEIKQGLATCFGSGQRKGLWPGELSLILRALTSMVEEDPTTFNLTSGIVARQALFKADLQRLDSYPKVLEQIQEIWKEKFKMTRSKKKTGSSEQYKKNSSTPDLLDTYLGDEQLYTRTFTPMSNRYRKSLHGTSI